MTVAFLSGAEMGILRILLKSERMGALHTAVCVEESQNRLLFGERKGEHGGR